MGGGCNYLAQTQCGDRPMCDECDNNCGTTVTTTPDCGHVMDCTDLEDGWYPDLFNCAKYWHCDAERGTHFLCPNGLVYEASKVQCDYPDRVDCGSRPTCDSCDENCQ